MTSYLITISSGAIVVTRRIAAANPFKAMITALGMLTLVDKLAITASEIRITCRPNAPGKGRA